MAETIEHRMQRLSEANIQFYTIERKDEGRVKRPFPSMYVPGDPEGGLVRNLGYFSNRGHEFVCGIANAVEIPKDLVLSAMHVGYSMGCEDFKSPTTTAVLEIHGIYDPQIDATHYFLLPHRKYLRK